MKFRFEGLVLISLLLSLFCQFVDVSLVLGCSSTTQRAVLGSWVKVHPLEGRACTLYCQHSAVLYIVLALCFSNS